MKTKELFQLLKGHQDKSLLFEYLPGEFVKANYHITEVKHIKIDSVDCGARTDSWNETVIQLWESPKEIGKTKFMSVYKALSILNKVAKINPFDMDTEVKFEYSNDTFNTAQLFVNDFEINNQQLIFKLAVEKTNCKAKDTCETKTEKVETNEACCSEVGCC